MIQVESRGMVRNIQSKTAKEGDGDIIRAMLNPTIEVTKRSRQKVGAKKWKGGWD